MMQILHLLVKNQNYLQTKKNVVLMYGLNTLLQVYL